MLSNTYLKNVASLALDESKCVGCGLCLEVCPHQVLAMANEKASIANLDACMECGACQENCPTAALSVEAGVGCAAAVINSALGRKGGGCCCVAEPRGGRDSTPGGSGCGPGCC